MNLSEEENNITTDLRDSIIHICDLERFSQLLQGEFKPGPDDFILTDSNTRRYCLPLLQDIIPEFEPEHVITILEGEQNKSTESLEFIWKTLLANGAGRFSRLYCLGGGMLTDIGGFAASTFMRGIRFINIPTTLIGMADASIGGKTAVNLHDAKNVAGVFALPDAVLVYPGFLDTLPQEELLSGYAEIVKISLVKDFVFWEEISSIAIAGLADRKHHELAPVISKAVRAKASLVSEDLKDTGVRQCLNFGHTIGHAMEELSLKKGNPVKHGFAVASGMLCETYLSMKRAGLAPESQLVIESYLIKNFPIIRITYNDIPEIMANLFHDKKKNGGNSMFSLLKAPGQCLQGIACELKLIEESLLHYISILP